MSSGLFLAFPVVLVVKSAVTEGSAVLVFLQCCKRRPFHDVFALLIIIHVDMVDRSIPAHLFSEEDIYG